MRTSHSADFARSDIASADDPRSESLAELFAAQVRRTPDAIAVSCDGRRLTYCQLDEEAGRLAGELRASGIVADGFVGILLDRSLDYVVAVLGVLKAGCAYAPLPADHPRDRLAFIVGDTRMPVVVTERRLADRLPTRGPRSVFMEDREFWQRDDVSAPAAAHGAPAESPAYVMYTSGSTGRPKGVVVPQRAVVRLVCGQSYVPFGPRLRTLLLAPTAFDASTFELWAPLLHGGICAIYSAPLPEPDRLGEILRSEGVNCLFLTTGLFNHVIDERPDILGPVEHLLTGGEVISMSHVRRAVSALPNTRLIHAYGPTESTTFATTQPIDGSVSLDTGTIPIGRPLARTSCVMVDDDLRPVPVGTPGELLIGGDGLAIGYLGDPELTARKFVVDPFRTNSAARFYRTGDRCRWLPDGTIEFLGRDDGQVKIRGHRIEVGEIEATLSTHPAVRQAAVVVRTVEHDTILRACVVPYSGHDVTPRTFRDHLATSLPAAMIPAEWLLLESLPLTANGKVDRQLLATGVAAWGHRDAVGLPPRGDTEHRLATIWESVLGVQPPDREANFFDLGGHSLQAMRLIGRLTREFGVRVPLRRVFEEPTLAGLAAEIEARLRERAAGSGTVSGAARESIASVVSSPSTAGDLPATSAQQGMWLLRTMLPDPATYNQAFVLRLTGPVDSVRLRRALRQLVVRHAALRTGLVMRDDRLVQQVLPAADAEPPCRELTRSTAPPEERRLSLDELLVAEARRPFDLARPPLWRVLIAEWEAGGRAVLFTFHHAIVDDWSLRLFLRDLQRCYAAATGSADERASAAHAAFAMAVPAEATAVHEEFWRRELSGAASGLPWPAVSPQPDATGVADGRGGWHSFLVEPELVPALRGLGQREGSTLFTVMLTAWHVWLHRFTGADDVVVGAPVACRWQPEAEEVVGCLLNTLPVRLRWGDTPSLDEARFTGVLRTVRDTFRAAVDHVAVPFERIVQLASREAADGRSPVCRVLFVLVEDELPAVVLGDNAVVPEVIHTRSSKYDLSLYVQCAADGLRCGLEYDGELFDAPTITSIGEQFAALLRSIVADGDAAVSRLGLLSETERRRVVHDFNATAVDFKHPATVHEWVFRQARLTPDAVALESAAGTLTYAELERRAGRFARTLRRRGIGPGSRVGLGCERSLEMVVGMLGILEAGAAYVPFDPALPPQRLAAMIEDSGVRLVATRPGAGASWPDGTTTVTIDDGAEPSGDEMRGPPTEVAADAPAYVIYTSGSTGTPKGVVVHHGAVCNFLAAMQHRFPLAADDVMLQSTVATFDISVYELFAPLVHGVRLVLADAGRIEPDRLLDCVIAHGVTVAQFGPSLLDVLVDARRFSECRSLRRVFCGGETMPRDLMRRFQARSAAALVNIYGPTEATVWATAWECDPASADRPPPIGLPLANTRVYVLDGRLEPQPVGVAGELYIGGAQVALGYLGRPDLTAERFVPDPFAPPPSGRLYRTGDLCRWRGDRMLDFLGRIDQQVKIRGHRIELGEIETVLRRHETVEQAVVLPRDARRPDGGQEAVLRACVVPRPQATIDVGVLRQWLADALPEPMLPAEWLVVDAIPLLSNGKVDRRTLASAATTTATRPASAVTVAAGRDGLTPRTLLEAELLEIWRRLFGRDDIRRTDNFFEIGGHSLLAARLAAEVERGFGHRVPIAAVFQSPTVESLARKLGDQSWMPRWASLVPLQTRGSRTPLFCVHGWGGDVYGFVDLARRLAPEQPVYGLQAVGLDGTVPRHRTVEEMAAHYVRDITSFHETGPYFICGQSLGGWIAYDMARQLRAAGREVTLLLFDTHPNHATVPRYRVAQGIEAVYKLTQIPGVVTKKALRLARLAAAAWRAGLGLPQSAATPPEWVPTIHNSRRREYFARVIDRYLPGPCDWRVELFQSTDLPARLLPLFWRQLAGRHVRVHRAGCSHMEMLEKASAGIIATMVSNVLASRDSGHSIPHRGPLPRSQP